MLGEEVKWYVRGGGEAVLHHNRLHDGFVGFCHQAHALGNKGRSRKWPHPRTRLDGTADILVMEWKYS